MEENKSIDIPAEKPTPEELETYAKTYFKYFLEVCEKYKVIDNEYYEKIILPIKEKYEEKRKKYEAEINKSYIEYASLWNRLCAHFLDGLVILLIFFPYILLYGNKSSAFNQIYLICLIIVVFSFLESSNMQGTFGKLICGIKVVGINGERISFLNSLIRNVIKFLSLGLCAFTSFVPLFSDEKKAIHDYIAQTFVAKKNSLINKS